MRRAGRAGRQAGGFTLIELLAVMAIMMLMTVIAMTSYFGATRGAAMRGAITHLQDTLTLARQAAIMQRRAAHVLFSSQGEAPSYVICLHEGTGTGDATRKVLGLDEFDNREGLVQGGEVYNLNTGARTTIATVHAQSITTQDAIWTGECKYGWAVSPTVQLPDGFTLWEVPPGRFPLSVLFNPDGTTRTEDYTIRVLEETDTRGYGEVKVAGPTGFVSSAIVAGQAK